MRRGCAIAVWMAAVLGCVATGTAQAQAAAAGEVQRFDVLEFEIAGNSVLAVAAIEAAVTPFLGPGRSMADVESARAALERSYQQSGFLTVFVDVPEQRVDGGVVRLQVLQGRLDRVRVVGARYYAQGVIRDTVPELTPGNTPDFNRVQQQLAELNRSDTRRVQPVLRPGRTPGTVDLDLQVEDRLPLQASIELNDRHPADTRPLRLSANVRYDNLWQRGHGIGLTLTTAPQAPSTSRQALLNYSVPLQRDATLSAFAAYSDSLTEPLGVSVAGKGLDVGLRWSQPLPPPNRDGGFIHSLTLGADYKDFETDTVFGDSGVLTPLRYLPLQAGYAADVRGSGWQSSLNTQFTFALREVLRRSVDCADAGRLDQFACSSRDADGSFAHWRADLRARVDAPLRTSLGLRLAWQLALQPLVSNERFALGGVDSVRGYYDAEAQGDRGLLGSVEWRSRNLAAAPGGPWLGTISDAVGYAFIDVAQVNIVNALPEQPSHTQLRGAGFGLQWRAGRHASGNLDLAWPLTSTADTRSRDLRLHVRLAVSL